MRQSAAFLLMCDELLEAVEEIPKKIPEIPKIPIPDEAIVKEIPTATPATPVNQVHFNLSGLMKQINIFIAYCIILDVVYMYEKYACLR